MSKGVKRLISILLTVAMLISVFPASAFAATKNELQFLEDPIFNYNEITRNNVTQLTVFLSLLKTAADTNQTMISEVESAIEQGKTSLEGLTVEYFPGDKDDVEYGEDAWSLIGNTKTKEMIRDEGHARVDKLFPLNSVAQKMGNTIPNAAAKAIVDALVSRINLKAFGERTSEYIRVNFIGNDNYNAVTNYCVDLTLADTRTQAISLKETLGTVYYGKNIKKSDILTAAVANYADGVDADDITITYANTVLSTITISDNTTSESLRDSDIENGTAEFVFNFDNTADVKLQDNLKVTLNISDKRVDPFTVKETLGTVNYGLYLKKSDVLAAAIQTYADGVDAEDITVRYGITTLNEGSKASVLSSSDLSNKTAKFTLSFNDETRDDVHTYEETVTLSINDKRVQAITLKETLGTVNYGLYLKKTDICTAAISDYASGVSANDITVKYNKTVVDDMTLSSILSNSDISSETAQFTLSFVDTDDAKLEDTVITLTINDSRKTLTVNKKEDPEFDCYVSKIGLIEILDSRSINERSIIDAIINTVTNDSSEDVKAAIVDDLTVEFESEIVASLNLFDLGDTSWQPWNVNDGQHRKFCGVDLIYHTDRSTEKVRISFPGNADYKGFVVEVTLKINEFSGGHKSTIATNSHDSSDTFKYFNGMYATNADLNEALYEYIIDAANSVPSNHMDLSTISFTYQADLAGLVYKELSYTPDPNNDLEHAFGASANGQERILITYKGYASPATNQEELKEEPSYASSTAIATISIADPRLSSYITFANERELNIYAHVTGGVFTEKEVLNAVLAQDVTTYDGDGNTEETNITNMLNHITPNADGTVPGVHVKYFIFDDTEANAWLKKYDYSWQPIGSQYNSILSQFSDTVIKLLGLVGIDKLPVIHEFGDLVTENGIAVANSTKELIQITYDGEVDTSKDAAGLHKGCTFFTDVKFIDGRVATEIEFKYPGVAIIEQAKNQLEKIKTEYDITGGSTLDQLLDAIEEDLGKFGNELKFMPVVYTPDKAEFKARVLEYLQLKVVPTAGDNEGTTIASKDENDELLSMTPELLDVQLPDFKTGDCLQTVKITYVGDKEFLYQPTSKDINVLMIPATSEFDVKSTEVTYDGQSWNLGEGEHKLDLITSKTSKADDATAIPYVSVIAGIDGDATGFVSIEIPEFARHAMVDKIRKALPEDNNKSIYIKIMEIISPSWAAEYQEATAMAMANAIVDYAYNDFANRINNDGKGTPIKSFSGELLEYCENTLNKEVTLPDGSTSNYGKLIGLDSDALGELATVIGKLNQYDIVGTVVKVGIGPTNAGLYAVTALTTDLNYWIRLGAGSIVVKQQPVEFKWNEVITEPLAYTDVKEGKYGSEFFGASLNGNKNDAHVHTLCFRVVADSQDMTNVKNSIIDVFSKVSVDNIKSILNIAKVTDINELPSAILSGAASAVKTINDSCKEFNLVSDTEIKIPGTYCEIAYVLGGNYQPDPIVITRFYNIDYIPVEFELAPNPGTGTYNMKSWTVAFKESDGQQPTGNQLGLISLTYEQLDLEGIKSDDITVKYYNSVDGLRGAEIKAPVNAGTYIAAVSYLGNSIYKRTTQDFTVVINPTTIEDFEIKNLKNAYYTGQNIKPSFDVIDKATGEIKLVENTDYTVSYKIKKSQTDEWIDVEAPKEVDEYKVIVTGINNYKETIEDTFKISRRPVSSSKGKYDVLKQTTVSNGTVTSNKSNANANDVVTLTTTPDKDFKLNVINVISRDGEFVELTSLGDGKYSFVMPKSDVDVYVSFDSIVECEKDADCVIVPFADTKYDYWWHDELHYILELGIMKGLSATTFAPYATTTRAQIVTMFWRLAGSPVVNYAMKFTDLEADWYEEAVRWAASTGIVEGYNEKEFGPNDAITREQFAAIMYRYANLNKLGFAENANKTFALPFKDDKSIHSYAGEAMRWCYVMGAISGRPGLVVDPKGTATRAEAAIMMYRFCGIVVDEQQ